MSTNANICQRLRTLSESLGADAEICDYAAERIEELEKQLADLHTKDSVRTTEHNILVQENRALAAQLADAKADGERLDWLESSRHGVTYLYSTNKPIVSKGIGFPAYVQDNLRAAIDAARKP